MLYKHGLPFSGIVAVNIDDLLNRIDRKKASLLILDGLMGEGKTTLAVEIAQYVYNKTLGNIEVIKLEKNFYEKWGVDYNKQLAMGGEAFQERLQLCKDSGLKVIVYDEAGDFSKRGAITKFNAKLNRVFQTFRTFKVLVILCLPSFNILDNDLFNQGVPRILLNCHDRDDRCGNIRGYGLEEMFWLKYNMAKEVVPLKAYQRVLPNFRGHFLNLPKARDQELDVISTDAKAEVLSANILNNKGLVSYYDIAKKVGRSSKWTQQKIRDLKIKPATNYNQKNYYEEHIITRLEEEKGVRGRK